MYLYCLTLLFTDFYLIQNDIMIDYLHDVHIPVMGTGHSIDSPIRVAPYGINSVISIVDDLLVEKIRKHYCERFDKPYQNIRRNATDGRAKRITAYLELVGEIVSEKFEQVRQQPFFQSNDKAKYFELLPDHSSLKLAYNRLMELGEEAGEALLRELTERMSPGSVDVNIMAKVDGLQYNGEGEPMSGEFSDASAALRGYANSSLTSSLVLSAGFNPRLYSYLSEFRDFYRDATGRIKKKIILKVSDFRSAFIQGKFLAKKGIEISEFRIESGLNCGGHTFPSDGHLMPTLLKEFRENKQRFEETFIPMVKEYYEQQGWNYTEGEQPYSPAITVQGGIGVTGERERLMNDFDMDATGWGSPFLLVPEATCVDGPTRELVRAAGEEELYLSNVSPLGVPFNNIRDTGSEAYTKERIEKDKPGSPCPKGFLESNTEFTEQPICTASNQYQILKLNQINESDLPEEEKSRRRQEVLAKTCLCDHLGNGALISLGIVKESRGRQAICPGPNVAWFNGTYTLGEMMDHIYGRIPSLVPEERPHMFAKELAMYVDYVEDLAGQMDQEQSGLNKLRKIRKNLEQGMAYCLEIASGEPYPQENLQSLEDAVVQQRARLEKIFERLESRQMAEA